MKNNNRLKFSLDDAKMCFEEKGLVLLSDKYERNTKKMIAKNKEGYYLYISLTDLKNCKTGDKNIFWHGNSYAIKNMNIYLQNNSINMKIIEEETNYTSSSVKIKCQCECGNVFYRSWNTIKNKKAYVCQECKHNKISEYYRYDDEYVMNIIKDKGFSIDGAFEYKNRKSIIEIIDKDGYKYTTTIDKLLYHPPQRVSKYNKYTIYNIKKFIYDNNWEVELLSNEYVGEDELLMFRCACGEEFLTTYRRFKKGKTRCSKCSDVKSKYENLVMKFLEKYNISYELEKKFDDLKDTYYLRFDFYIESLNIAIECDGHFHFHEIEMCGRVNDAAERLKVTQKHDNAKNLYCENKGIKLIRIPYWEFDNGNYIKTLKKELNIL